MQLIKPKQISGEIMTLIEEADKEMIFISPYYNISQWDKLIKSLDGLKRRKVKTEFYVRAAETKSIQEVRKSGFQVVEIENLHTKLYFNEKDAIVSSMNLNISSDNHSLDIAMKTETKKEYDELRDYYQRYIVGSINKPTESPVPSYHNWKQELRKRLKDQFNKFIDVHDQNDAVEINTSNKYEVFISKEQTNVLCVTGILSSAEFEFASSNKNLIQANKMQIELKKGGSKFYDTIWGTIPNFKSYSIHSLQKQDESIILEVVVKFIIAVEELKKLAYQKVKQRY